MLTVRLNERIQDRRAIVKDLLDEQPNEVVELVDDQKRQISELIAKLKSSTVPHALSVWAFKCSPHNCREKSTSTSVRTGS